jgi:hypothetical protein
VVSVIRRVDAKEVEVLVLRHQLEVLHRQKANHAFDLRTGSSSQP